MSTVLPTKPTKKSRRKRMLSPAAYCEATLPSLKLAESSRFARVVARVLFAAMVVASIVVAIAPWQQSVKGNGNVIAYAPLERQQTIESPIKGRILRLGDGVFENAHVVKNQLIAEVADIDSDYLFRLEAQVETAKRQLEASKSIKEANEKTLEAAKTIVTAFDNQIAAYTIVKEKVIAEADADIEAAKNKIALEQHILSRQKSTDLWRRA